jgi:hypothetical protein
MKNTRHIADLLFEQRAGLRTLNLSDQDNKTTVPEFTLDDPPKAPASTPMDDLFSGVSLKEQHNKENIEHLSNAVKGVTAKG